MKRGVHWCLLLTVIGVYGGSDASEPFASLRALPGATLIDTDYVIGPAFELRAKVRSKSQSSVALVLRESGSDVSIRIISPAAKFSPIEIANPVQRSGYLVYYWEQFPVSGVDVEVVTKHSASYHATLHLLAYQLDASKGASDYSTRRILTEWSKAGIAYSTAIRARSANSRTNDYKANIKDSRNHYVSAAALALLDNRRELNALALLHSATISYEHFSDWETTVKEAGTAEKDFDAAKNQYLAAVAKALRAAAIIELATFNAPPNNNLQLPRKPSELFDIARKAFESVRDFHALGSEEFQSALATNNIGLSYLYEGKYKQAADQFSKALTLFGDIRDVSNQAMAANNRALVDFMTGDTSGCVTGYARALKLIDERNEPQAISNILHNSALCHAARGDFDSAIRSYTRSLEIRLRLQNDREVARSLVGLGAAYYALGDYRTALKLYSQALPLRPAATDARGRAATLRGLATIYRDIGDINEAIAARKQALSLSIDPNLAARTQIDLALDLIQAQRTNEAETLLNAIQTRVLQSDSRVSALADSAKGRLAIARNDLRAAAIYLHRARPVFKEQLLVAEQAEAIYLLALIAYRQQSYAPAMNYLQAGIELTENLRGLIQNPELRASALASRRNFFDLKIEVLLASSVDPNAAANTLKVAEQARARVFDELRQRSLSIESDETIETRKHLLREINAKRAWLASLEERARQDDGRAYAIRNEIVSLEAQLNLLLDSGTARGSLPISERDLQALQARLDNDSVIIEYWMGETSAYAWTITKDKIRYIRIANPQVLTHLAMELHEALSTRRASQTEIMRIAQALHSYIIAPLEEVRTKNRWIVMPDGVLHYVPFSLLGYMQSPGSSLKTFDVAIAPSLHSLMQAGQAVQPRTNSSLLIADPVFEKNDGRLSKNRKVTSKSERDVLAQSQVSIAQLTRLPASGTEVASIANILRSETTTLLVGFDANRDLALMHMQTPLDVIHLATHARVESEMPQLSFLALSSFRSDGSQILPYVYMADFWGLRLNANLVVLSACDTAVGKQINGEALMGLSFALLSNGANNVVASLWKTPDAATSRLMTYFYSGLVVDRLAPAAALSQAQRQLANSKNWADPRNWAAFTVYQRAMP